MTVHLLARSRREPDPRPTAAALGVDPTACTGVGICALVAPDLVGLDAWGYPVVPDRDLRGPERRSAGRAVAACPRRALALLPR